MFRGAALVFAILVVGVAGAVALAGPIMMPSHRTTTAQTGTGTLTAAFGVGPTQPVCYVNQTATSAGPPYEGITAVVTSTAGARTTVPLSWTNDGCNASASLTLSLSPGNYRLDLSSCPWLGCSRSLPVQFSIVAARTTTITVSIDTGIR